MIIVQLWKVPVSYSYDKLEADNVTNLGSRALGGFCGELVACLYGYYPIGATVGYRPRVLFVESHGMLHTR